MDNTIPLAEISAPEYVPVVHNGLFQYTVKCNLEGDKVVLEVISGKKYLVDITDAIKATSKSPLNLDNVPRV